MNTIVVNINEETRTPFLRGILIRTLLDAGLNFEEALDLATAVRDELIEEGEVDSEDLRTRVEDLLEALDDEALAAYRLVAAAPARITVNSMSGSVSPFSRGRHTRYLQSSGIRMDKAEQSTNLLYDQLLATGVTSISTCQLGYLTYLCLQEEISKKAAHRYLVWSEYQRSARPLLLLICGTVGSGKSTVATEVAHLLEIVRIQSTDMLREVMRMMVPKRLLPILHTSSFSAWKTLPVTDTDARTHDGLVAEGYRNQVELLSVPCEAVMQRAIEESVPLILEGVHAHPELLDRQPDDSDAIAVHVTLAVLKSGDLKSRLRGRGVEVPQRRAKRYLNSFDSIWSLQSYLLTEADRYETPIITNKDKDKTVHHLIQHVNYVLSKTFRGTAESVFGDSIKGMLSTAETGSWQDVVELVNTTDETDMSC